MLKIGDFARLGRVSIRMLRHYDEIGLLEPASVDPWSGHRGYSAGQLARLNRIVAFKELGLTLDQVRTVLAEDVSAEQMQGMLRLRRLELSAQAERTAAALVAVEYRLRLIEKENTMSAIDVVTKPLPALRIQGLRASVASQAEVGPQVGPMFDRCVGAVLAAGGVPTTGVGLYDATGDGMIITAGFACDGDPAPGLEIMEIPAVPLAATTFHLGTMEHIGETWTDLMNWIEANGYIADEPCREIYVHAPQGDMTDWVTELQSPVHRPA